MRKPKKPVKTMITQTVVKELNNYEWSVTMPEIRTAVAKELKCKVKDVDLECVVIQRYNDAPFNQTLAFGAKFVQEVGARYQTEVSYVHAIPNPHYKEQLKKYKKDIVKYEKNKK